VHERLVRRRDLRLLGQACCAGDFCTGGYATCNNNVCEPCGGLGQDCCDLDTCVAPFACDVTGTCAPACGGEGDPCCGNGQECAPNLTCSGDTCQVP
jgi:hypothetical protein